MDRNILRFDCAGIAARAVTPCASRRRAARSCSTMPPRGSVREAKAFAERNGAWIAARLKRLPQTIYPSRYWRRSSSCAASRTASCTAPRTRGTVWTECADTGPRSSASPATSRMLDRRVRDFLKREARRDLERAAESYADRARRRGQARLHPRPVEPLGLVHAGRGVVVFLAPDPRAALRARLSRRPRGRPSRRDEPFGAILARGGAHLSADWERAKGWLPTAHGNAQLHRYGVED